MADATQASTGTAVAVPADSPVVASTTQGDPSGVPRPVQPGRLERSANNSGVIVGESKTTNTETGDAAYKTEFIKVYQDAGVVGAAMLTLLVLCCLLGLFCTRLIKMYTALTESRDNLEAARTVAIEKLTTSLVLLRSETNTVVGELRREHDSHTDRLRTLTSAIEKLEERSVKNFDLQREIHSRVETLVRETGDPRHGRRS